ncbi:MAG TPA: hypothetical protein VFE24_13790 [Pirellulales bacterium]|nr:hypothetical protein [Pirellulales bacterium]
MRYLAVLLVIATWGSSVTWGAEPDSKADHSAAEKKFIDLLSGSTLVGNYTLVTPKGISTQKEDKYTIESVKKYNDHIFTITTRIQYDGHDVSLPLAVPVAFVGDTAMIDLDKFPVPGLGTFSAKVLFDGDKYAGTWDAGDHGGHLFGRIEKAKSASK